MKTISLVLATSFASLAMGACMDPDTVDGQEAESEVGEETATKDAFQVGTTSVCVRRSSGTTVRIDGVGIASNTSESTTRSVLVPTGVTESPYDIKHMVFVEAGGRYEPFGRGAMLHFVARGGTAFIVNAGGGQQGFAKAGSTFNCPVWDDQTTLFYELGANLGNCAGRVRTVQQSVTDTFSRCTPTTVTNQVYPTVQFAVSLTGDIVKLTNQTRGTLINGLWQIWAISPSPSPIQPSRLVFQRTVSGSLAQWTMPSDFRTKYPAAAGWRLVAFLSGTDPFGKSIAISNNIPY